MGENLPLSVKLDDNPNGTVTFASDVVATMAGLAATEVEGVFSMYSSSSGFGDIFTRRSQNSKNSHTKGVKVDVADNKVAVDVSIVVDYGTPVPQIAREIQENVKKAVETMSGLEVSHVDVHIQGVSFEREHKAQQELLEQQKAAMLSSSRTETRPQPAPVPRDEEPPETPAVPVVDEDEAAEADGETEEAAEAADEIDEDDDDFELVLEDVPEEEEENDPEERPEE